MSNQSLSARTREGRRDAKKLQTRDDRRTGKQTVAQMIDEHRQDLEEAMSEAAQSAAAERRELILAGIDPDTNEEIYRMGRLNELTDELGELTEHEQVRYDSTALRLFDVDLYDREMATAGS